MTDYPRVHRNSSYLNAKSTTGTTTRVKDASPTSGMCPICIRDCPFLCEGDGKHSDVVFQTNVEYLG